MPNRGEWEQLSPEEIIRRVESRPFSVVNERLKELPYEKIEEVWMRSSLTTRRRLSHVIDETLIHHFRHKSWKQSEKDGTDSGQDSNRDYLQYELERIHRENLESELSQIRDSIGDYFEHSRRHYLKQRRESVYVLVALGIISAFFTIYPKLQTISESFSWIAVGSAVSSAVFLFIKLNTVGLGYRYPGKVGEQINDIADLLFRLAASGTFVVAVGIIVTSQFEGLIEDVPSGAATLVLSAFVVIVTFFSKFAQIRVSHSNSVTFTEVQDEMFELATEDVTEQSIEEFLDLIEEYKDSTGSEDTLVQLRKRMRTLQGFTDEEADQILEKFDELIEEKSQESKSDAELREMRRKELEEEREALREQLSDILDSGDEIQPDSG